MEGAPCSPSDVAYLARFKKRKPVGVPSPLPPKPNPSSTPVSPPIPIPTLTPRPTPELSASIDKALTTAATQEAPKTPGQVIQSLPTSLSLLGNILPNLISGHIHDVLQPSLIHACTILIAVCTGATIICLILCKSTVIELKDWTTSFIIGIASFFTATTATPPSRRPIVASSLPPIIPHYTAWEPAAVLVDRDENKMGELITRPGKPVNFMKLVGEVGEFIDVYMVQLAADLEDARAKVEWLVQEVKETPLSRRCWGTSEAGFLQWMGGVWMNLRATCQRDLTAQVNNLQHVLQATHTSRLLLQDKMSIICNRKFPTLRDNYCRRAQILQGDQAEHISESDRQDLSKHAQDQAEMINNLGRIADRYDIVCTNLKVDKRSLDKKCVLMIRELEVLRVARRRLEAMGRTAAGVRSIEMAREMEKGMVEFAEKWLDLIAEYYLE
ncbi:hypothetical protein ACHAPI_011819 [Fusarium lateritium]